MEEVGTYISGMQSIVLDFLGMMPREELTQASECFLEERAPELNPEFPMALHIWIMQQSEPRGIVSHFVI